MKATQMQFIFNWRPDLFSRNVCSPGLFNCLPLISYRSQGSISKYNNLEIQHLFHSPYWIFLFQAWPTIYFNCFEKPKAIQHVKFMCKLFEKWLTRWEDPTIFLKCSSDKIRMAYLWHPGSIMLGHYFIPHMAVIWQHFHSGTYSLDLNL